MSKSIPGDRAGGFDRFELGRALLTNVTIIVAAAVLPLLLVLHYVLRIQAEALALRWFAGIAFIVIAGAAFILHVMLKRITGPLAQLSQAMQRLAAGQLETPVPCLTRGDEIGAMAQALSNFRESLEDYARLRDTMSAMQARQLLRRNRIDLLVHDVSPRIETSLDTMGHFAGQVARTQAVPLAMRQEAAEIAVRTRTLRESFERAFLTLAGA